MQVFVGPRQVGKTTTALRLVDKEPAIFASADLPAPPNTDFIKDRWSEARSLAATIPHRGVSLVLDEVQKIPRWSEIVKGLWDEDQRRGIKIRVALLGSSAILIEKGLSESLTGRFETNYFPHWVFREVRELTSGISVDQFAMWGGYPKVYELIADTERASDYIENSILEPTLGRDILALHNVDKPALLRQLFWYVSRLPSQIVSFEKILGHLQDRGNSATLVHYAELLQQAFLVCPIFKYSGQAHRTKRSVPKWIFPNPALVNSAIKAQGNIGFLFENLVGSHILNLTYGRRRYEIKYFRDAGVEIDFILCYDGEPILAIEVKSGRIKKVPSAAVLKKANINCPFAIISAKNIERFLLSDDIETIVTEVRQLQDL